MVEKIQSWFFHTSLCAHSIPISSTSQKGCVPDGQVMAQAFVVTSRPPWSMQADASVRAGWGKSCGIVWDAMEDRQLSDLG